MLCNGRRIIVIKAFGRVKSALRMEVYLVRNCEAERNLAHLRTEGKRLAAAPLGWSRMVSEGADLTLAMREGGQGGDTGGRELRRAL